MTTFDELLTQLEEADDELDTLKTDMLVTDIADKIDAIKHVTEKLENYIHFLEKKIEPLEKAKRSARRNIAAIKESLALSLESHGVSEFPGVVWRLALQDSPAAIEYSRPVPTGEDYESYPEKVGKTLVYYWRAEEVRKSLKDGEEFEFAKLKHGKHVRWYLKKPFRAKKAAPALLEEAAPAASEPARISKYDPTF